MRVRFCRRDGERGRYQARSACAAETVDGTVWRRRVLWTTSLYAAGDLDLPPLGHRPFFGDQQTRVGRRKVQNVTHTGVLQANPVNTFGELLPQPDLHVL
ncbi:MAG: hypothetical protein DMF85_01930 [Acidobacteria bacterium]|nr:MAG: hypothetical protein DMF85_01930 [Acidobacteriota bacterium]